MSYSAKQYLLHEERRLEPGIIVHGTQRRYKETSMAAKNKWLNGLTPEQREYLRNEYEQESEKNKYR